TRDQQSDLRRSGSVAFIRPRLKRHGFVTGLGTDSLRAFKDGGATPAFAAAEGLVPISQERQCGETMRKAAGYVAILMSIAVLFLATSGASTAYAGGGNGGSPPGNNGVVKVIRDPGDSQNDPDNDPQVCLFHLYGFNFD